MPNSRLFNAGFRALSLNFPLPMYTAIAAVAAARYTNKASIIRQFVVEGLARVEAQPQPRCPSRRAALEAADRG